VGENVAADDLDADDRQRVLQGIGRGGVRRDHALRFLYRLRRKQPNWLANLVSNFSEFALKGYVVLVAPILTMFYVRSQIFGQLRPPELPWVDNPLAMPGVSFLTARITAIKVIGKYFWLLLWPQQLSCDYSYNQIPIVNWHFNTWEDWKAIVALVSIVIVLLVAIRNYHRNKPLFFFVFFFFGTLLPSSNLIPNPTFGQSLSRQDVVVHRQHHGRTVFVPAIDRVRRLRGDRTSIRSAGVSSPIWTSPRGRNGSGCRSSRARL
jgi:hypothetical protein